MNGLLPVSTQSASQPITRRKRRERSVELKSVFVRANREAGAWSIVHVEGEANQDDACRTLGASDREERKEGVVRTGARSRVSGTRRGSRVSGVLPVCDVSGVGEASRTKDDGLDAG
jgi:hypothetical protein